MIYAYVVVYLWQVRVVCVEKPVSKFGRIGSKLEGLEQESGDADHWKEQGNWTEQNGHERKKRQSCQS